MVKMIREVGETDRTKVRPKLLKASLMNGKRQNMREICIDDNSNDERQEALAQRVTNCRIGIISKNL